MAQPDDFVGPFPSRALGATKQGPMEGAAFREEVERFIHASQ